MNVGTDGGWFCLLDGTRVDLSTRRVLRLLLVALVERHLSQPGTAQPVDTLVGLVWPAERIRPDCARNRLYVAVSTLRSLGLAEVVIRRPDGYLIDPAVVVTRSGPRE